MLFLCTCRECCLATGTGTCSSILPWQQCTVYVHTTLKTRWGWWQGSWYHNVFNSDSRQPHVTLNSVLGGSAEDLQWDANRGQSLLGVTASSYWWWVRKSQFTSILIIYTLIPRSYHPLCPTAACQQVKSLLPLSVGSSWKMRWECVATPWHSPMPKQLQPRFRWDFDSSNARMYGNRFPL